jgi:predicted nucleic acid-binding protein
MPYLLDTNHCFRLIARDDRMIAALNERPLEQLMTSVVVAGELRYGALISERRIENALAGKTSWAESIKLRFHQPSLRSTPI